jgi:hypothetical protein
LSDSIGSQEPSSYNIKEKSKQANSTQWVKTFLVIHAKAGMTTQQKIAQFRFKDVC